MWCPSRTPPKQMYAQPGHMAWPLNREGVGGVWSWGSYIHTAGYGDRVSNPILWDTIPDHPPWHAYGESGYSLWLDWGPSSWWGMGRYGVTDGIGGGRDAFQPETGRFPVVNDHFPKMRGTNVMFMDQSYGRQGNISAWYGDSWGLPQGAYYGVSNHPLPGPEGVLFVDEALLGPKWNDGYGMKETYCVLADGMNAVMFDGAVYWADMTGWLEVYAKDYYIEACVDEFLAILPVSQKINSWVW